MHIGYYVFVMCSSSQQLCKVALASISSGMIVSNKYLFIYLFLIRSYPSEAKPIKLP